MLKVQKLPIVTHEDLFHRVFVCENQSMVIASIEIEVISLRMCAFIVRANSPYLIFLWGSICSAMTVSSPYCKEKGSYCLRSLEL